MWNAIVSLVHPPPPGEQGATLANGGGIISTHFIVKSCAQMRYFSFCAQMNIKEKSANDMPICANAYLRVKHGKVE